MNHYLLERDGETQIVAICEGNDPLYGRGSWNLQAGPYTSVELTKAAAEPIRYWAADYTVWGVSLDGAAIERITAAWIAAVEAEGALLAGGLAEVDADGERIDDPANA